MRWASKGKDIHAISYHDTIKLTKRSSPLSRKKGQKGEAHFVKITKITNPPSACSPLN